MLHLIHGITSNIFRTFLNFLFFCKHVNIHLLCPTCEHFHTLNFLFFVNMWIRDDHLLCPRQRAGYQLVCKVLPAKFHENVVFFYFIGIVFVIYVSTAWELGLMQHSLDPSEQSVQDSCEMPMAFAVSTTKKTVGHHRRSSHRRRSLTIGVPKAIGGWHVPTVAAHHQRRHMSDGEKTVAKVRLWYSHVTAGCDVRVGGHAKPTAKPLA
jgi:hypothetical protein